MIGDMPAAWTVLGLVVLQRVFELYLARRNTLVLKAEGAYEVGAGHYPVIVAVHGAGLASIAAWIAVGTTEISLMWLIAYVVLQAARVWVMVSLGRYWTTRIIVVPHATLVVVGPYRYLKHPNYWVVAAEIATLPMVFDAWPLAVSFSVLNAAVLAMRIAIESRSLEQRAASMARPRATNQSVSQPSTMLH